MKRKFKVGDILMVGVTRWVIRAIDAKGKTALEAMNHPNHSVWWTTTTKILEEQAA